MTNVRSFFIYNKILNMINVFMLQMQYDHQKCFRT